MVLQVGIWQRHRGKQPSGNNSTGHFYSSFRCAKQNSFSKAAATRKAIKICFCNHRRYLFQCFFYLVFYWLLFQSRFAGCQQLGKLVLPACAKNKPYLLCDTGQPYPICCYAAAAIFRNCAGTF